MRSSYRSKVPAIGCASTPTSSHSHEIQARPARPTRRHIAAAGRQRFARRQQRPPDPTAIRYVTENAPCREAAAPKVATLSATPSGKPDIAPVSGTIRRLPRSTIDGQSIDAPDLNVGVTL